MDNLFGMKTCRDIIVWVELEEDYGVAIKMNDACVWVKLRKSEDIVTLAHNQIEILSNREIKELSK